MSQYKVPQNIDMQDRIVGPLTLYQFLYVLAGGMVAYATFKSGVMLSFIFLGIPAGILSLVFAFIKINEQTFAHFFMSFAFYLINPKQRLWHHGSGTTKISLTQPKDTGSKRVTVKQFTKQDFSRAAESLDRRQS